MRFSRSMARFAALPLRALMFVECCFPVRTLVIALGHVFMAALARLRANVLRWIHRRMNRGRRILLLRLTLLVLASLGGRYKSYQPQYKQQHEEKPDECSSWHARASHFRLL